MAEKLIEKFAGFAGRFYERTSGLGGWLSGALRLGWLSRWSERYLKKPGWLFTIELAAAVSLTVYFFFLMLPEGDLPRSQDSSTANVYLFANMSKHPAPIQEDYATEFPAWGPRVASQVLTAKFWDAAVYLHKDGKGGFGDWKATWNGYNFHLFSVTFATYQAAWIALLFGLLIWYRPDALLIMLGTFAGLAYNLTIPSGEWYFPWDLPELCLFTWMILVFDRGQYLRLLVVIWLASVIKETGMVGGLLVLFGPWSWRKRLLGFGGLFAAFLVSRELLLRMYHVHTIFLPFNNATGTGSFLSTGLAVLRDNLVNLFSFHLNSAWFADCGLLFLLLLLPGNSVRHLLLKFMALVFIGGQFLFGYAHEFREWYEMLPLAWMLVGETVVARAPMPREPVKARPGRAAAGQKAVQPAFQVAAGGYRLALVGTLVIVAAVLVGAWTGIIAPLKVPAPPPPVASAPGVSVPGQTMLYGDVHVQNVIALNNLAWQLATSPQDDIRNGSLAVQMAEHACQLTHYQDPNVVGTLAAAYAEAGRFDDAITNGLKACALAASLGNTNVNEQNRDFLLLYQAHKPLRDTNPVPLMLPVR